jgi:hypothetical protein
VDTFLAGKDFHLKEYESLKKELGELVEHSRKLEIYVVAGIAAFYAWYLTGQAPRPPREALYIPILVVFLGAFRSWSVLTRIQEVAQYIRDLEQVFALSDRKLIGWETYRHKPENDSSPFLSSASVVWLTLLASSVFAKCLL